MRPLSHVRLLCGDELADKHRHAYNRLTTFLEEKQEQHAQLKGILQAAGHEVDVVPLIFGTTGCIYKSCEGHLKQLGVSHDCTQRLLRTLALDAARSAHTIIKPRRQHEHKPGDNSSNGNSRRSQPP